jgi:hypothetical protein
MARTAEELIAALRELRTCDDEPDKCYEDSGPYCGAHDFADIYVPLLREAADELERLSVLLEDAHEELSDEFGRRG